MTSKAAIAYTHTLVYKKPTIAESNYQYDTFGNPTNNLKEYTTCITLTVYGKLNTLSKTDGVGYCLHLQCRQQLH
ncbi:MAG TPA: hypothetical protein PKD90_15600 [Phnomibacter sp.]|nr:hypothetical protein [Phnomibacter sp.]